MPSLLKRAKSLAKKTFGGGRQRPQPMQPQAQPEMVSGLGDSEASEDLSTLEAASEALGSSAESGVFDASSEVSVPPLLDEMMELGASSAEASDEWETGRSRGDGERRSLLGAARASAAPTPEPKYGELSSVGDHYRGEHEEAHWRYAGESAGSYSKIMTAAYGEAERDAHRVDVDEEGRLLQGGAIMDTSGARGGRADSEADTFIFAMDGHGDVQAADQLGETQSMVHEARAAVLWARAYEEEHGQAPSEELLTERFGDHALAKQYLHHSSFFAGEDVAGAGELQIEEGRLKRLTPNSGHYKPGLEQTTNVANELAARGADLTSTSVDVNRLDAEGKARSDDKGHLVSERFHAGEVLAAQGDYGALMGKKDMLAELSALAPAVDEEPMSEFDITEDLESMYFEQGLSHEDCEAYAAQRGWTLLGWTGDFADVEERVGGGNLSRRILDGLVGGDRPSVEPEARAFAPELGRVLEAAPDEEEDTGYATLDSGYSVLGGSGYDSFF